MDRRAFLTGTFGGVGAAALSWPARGRAQEPTTTVFRLDRDAALWRPYVPTGPLSSVQRLRLLGPQLAAGSTLHALELDVLFASASARHRAWRFDASSIDGNSGPSSLALSEVTAQLQFRLQRSTDDLPEFMRVPVSGWAEGEYLIRLDSTSSVALACGQGSPCALPPGVDVFHLQVQAEHSGPDLCERADLACQQRDVRES